MSWPYPRDRVPPIGFGGKLMAEAIISTSASRRSRPPALRGKVAAIVPHPARRRGDPAVGHQHRESTVLGLLAPRHRPDPAGRHRPVRLADRGYERDRDLGAPSRESTRRPSGCVRAPVPPRRGRVVAPRRDSWGRGRAPGVAGWRAALPLGDPSSRPSRRRLASARRDRRAPASARTRRQVQRVQHDPMMMVVGGAASRSASCAPSTMSVTAVAETVAAHHGGHAPTWR